MPFEIIRNDITNMQVDAIVNTANPRPVVGSGCDTGIHEKAGPQLLAARKAIGDIRFGQCAITPGFDLAAKYVIHAVGPVWLGGTHGEEKLLRRCYDNALQLALENGCESIAFPLLSAGNYGFPKDRALQIALNAFSEFLMQHEMQIYLVVFNKEVFRLSEKLFYSVSSYIDENYIAAKEEAEYGEERRRILRAARRARAESEMLREASLAPECNDIVLSTCKDSYVDASPCPSMAKAASPKDDLTELLKKTDAGFSETLLKLIDQSGKKDPQIYTRANLTRQHFSKIRNNPNYKPTKATALALALALELNLEQTKDLIGRAGYALTDSSKFDVIIKYFIEHGIYDVLSINVFLYDFDQMPLGG